MRWVAFCTDSCNHTTHFCIFTRISGYNRVSVGLCVRRVHFVPDRPKSRNACTSASHAHLGESLDTADAWNVEMNTLSDANYLFRKGN